MKRQYVKKAAAGGMAAALVILAGCVGPLEQFEDEGAISPYKDYIVINTKSAGKSRSITTAGLDAVINYHELIALGFGPDGNGAPRDPNGATPGTVSSPIPITNQSAWVSSRRYKNASPLSIPVKQGWNYAVLYLEGWMPSKGDGDPVLKRASYGVTSGGVQPGANQVDVGSASSTIDFDFEDANRLVLDISAYSQTLPERKGTKGLLTYSWFKYDNGGTPNASDFKTSPAITLKGDFKALYNAKLVSDDGPTKTMSASESIFNTTAKWYLEPILDDGGFINKPWTGGKSIAYAWDGTTGKLGMTYNIILANDMSEYSGAGKLYFNAVYYGFSLDESVFDTANSVWDADKRFTRWIIRNGLTDELDYTQQTGGAIYIAVGDGGSLSGGNGTAGGTSNDSLSITVTAAP